MPTHMLANKTALEIIQELNAPLNLLKDLDLDIHKGNSIMRMMGHQATMDTAAAGQFVRDHPEEAQRLFLNLRPGDFKKQLATHITANKSGLSDAEVSAFVQEAYRAMAREMMALVKQQQLNTVVGPQKPVSDWNDPEGSGGTLLVSIMRTRQISIREAAQMLDSVGAFQPMSNLDQGPSDTLTSELYSLCAVPDDSDFPPVELYNLGMEFFDSLSEVGHLKIESMTQFSAMQFQQNMGVEDETLSDYGKEHNVDMADLRSGGVLDKDPFVRKMVLHRAPWVQTDDGRSLEEMLNPDVDVLLRDKRNPYIQQMLQNGGTPKDIKQALLQEITKQNDAIVMAMASIKASRELSNPEVEEMFEIHSTMQLYAGLRSDELDGVETGLGSLQEIHTKLQTLPPTVAGQTCMDYQQSTKKALLAHQNDKKQKKANRAQWEQTGQVLRERLALMSYKWLKEQG